MLSISWRAVARLIVLPGAAACAASSEGTMSAGVATRIDSIANAHVASGKLAGLSIGVMQGNDIVVMKGYGSADLELDVPTPARAIYEIGSVTKQFTAAAILQLRDAGKLALDDDVTKHLPDYPTGKRKVTIRRLLDHTSGIKGYTEIPAFGQLMLRDAPKDTLVKMFSTQPFEFEPGELEVYNNSAYFLAGLIIEKLSGMSYADYVKQNLFDKVGMPDSDYCSETKVVKRKVKGYEYGPDSALHHKGFIVHTWPYAAGSLCSSVNDLVAWNHALHNGRVIPAASYQEMITPAVLNDGTRLRYGAGLALRTVGGHRLIEHGGGIPGFISASHYYPDDSLIVVVLTNTAGPAGADDIAVDVAMAILGRRELKTETFSGDLTALTGTYSGVSRGQTMRAVVTAEGGKVVIRAGADQTVLQSAPPPPPKTLVYRGDGVWADGETNYVFVMSGATPTHLRVDQTYGYSILKRVP